MTPADILSLTCSGYGVSLDALRGPAKGRYVVMARRSAARSLSELGLSSLEIGPILGRDPSTVRYLLTTEPQTARTLHPAPHGNPILGQSGA
jgi:chromosomal replication initiation ATPase DnaA